MKRCRTKRSHRASKHRQVSSHLADSPVRSARQRTFNVYFGINGSSARRLAFWLRPPGSMGDSCHFGPHLVNRRLRSQAISELCSSWPARCWNICRARRRRGLSTQQDHVGEDHDVSRLSLPLHAPGACGCHSRHGSGTPYAAGHRSRATRRRRSSHAAGSHGSPCAGRRSRRTARCRSGEGQLQQDHGANQSSLIRFKQLHGGAFVQSSTSQEVLCCLQALTCQ